MNVKGNVRSILYGFLRFILWAGVVFIALFPTLQLSHVFPSWHFIGTMSLVNAAGHFRELFFIVVPAAAVSLSTTLDFLCGRPKNEITGLLVLIALVINIVVLLSGFIGFLLLPPDSGRLADDVFSLYSWLITLGLIISLVTELWISGFAANQRHTEPA